MDLYLKSKILILKRAKYVDLLAKDSKSERFTRIYPNNGSVKSNNANVDVDIAIVTHHIGTVMTNNANVIDDGGNVMENNAIVGHDKGIAKTCNATVGHDSDAGVDGRALIGVE